MYKQSELLTETARFFEIQEESQIIKEPVKNVSENLPDNDNYDVELNGDLALAYQGEH